MRSVMVRVQLVADWDVDPAAVTATFRGCLAAGLLPPWLRVAMVVEDGRPTADVTPDTPANDALSVRARKGAYRILDRLRDGVDPRHMTLRDISTLTAVQLGDAKNIGRATLTEIETVLARAGLTLAGTADHDPKE